MRSLFLSFMPINPYLFFLIQDGNILLWDYKNHQQFEITIEYFQRLLELSDGSPVTDSPVDQELLQAKALTSNTVQTPWEWDIVSQIFHIGTQDIPVLVNIESPEESTKGYIENCEASEVNLSKLYTEKPGPVITLPSYDLSIFEHENFLTVLKKRMTCRSFDNRPITLQELSSLLSVTFGETHGQWEQLDKLNLKQTGIRKTSPSGGALQSSEAYILALNIQGLQRGIYHYRSHQHVLSLVNPALPDNLGAILFGQHFAEELGVGIFITTRFDKLWAKYPHSRAYRVALLDIGHLSQTFQLCATAMGLDPWLTAAFIDTEVNQLLHIDNTSEQAMFFVGAGYGQRQFLDKLTLEFLSNSFPNKNML